MTSCRCERCSPVNPEPTYTDAYRLECLARYAMGQQKPRAFLDRWTELHGAASTQILRDEMTRQWRERAE